jgi:hypothetical protein
MRASVRHYTGTAIVYVKHDLPNRAYVEDVVRKIGGTGFKLANVALIFPYMSKTQIKATDNRRLEVYSIDDHVYPSIVVAYDDDDKFAAEISIP